MKALYRPDLFTWSAYDAALRMDFNSLLWRRPGGNVLVDPLPLTPPDEEHLAELGGAAFIVLTNSAHVRGAKGIAARTGAELFGPAGERDGFPISCERWLADGDVPFPGLLVRALEGSKTPGELVLVLEETTAIFGDAVRAGRADELALLPRKKLRDPAALLASLRRIRALHPRLAHVLVGDGWSVFRHGGLLLDELLAREGG